MIKFKSERAAAIYELLDIARSGSEDVADVVVRIYEAGWRKQSEPAVQGEPVALPPFATKIIEKLRRFDECAEDGQDVDIGRHWLDMLVQLGLLNRVQRSPALWEMAQQGEDVLEGYAAPQPAEQGEPDEQYNHKRIGWELERTAMGDGHYGNALRVAKDMPGLADQDRAVLDRYATGSQRGTDHIALQDIAMRIYTAPQPAEQQPDVSALVGALVACARASSAAEVGLIVDAALAAHRKGGGV